MNTRLASQSSNSRKSEDLKRYRETKGRVQIFVKLNLRIRIKNESPARTVAMRSREYRGTQVSREILTVITCNVNSNAVRVVHYLLCFSTIVATIANCSRNRELEVNRRSICCSISRISSGALMSSEWPISFANIVHIKPSETQLEGILYYSNPCPSIHQV